MFVKGLDQCLAQSKSLYLLNKIDEYVYTYLPEISENNLKTW